MSPLLTVLVALLLHQTPAPHHPLVYTTPILTWENLP